MSAPRAYTIRISPADVAWATVREFGTAADIERGAVYFARGRKADVIAMADRLSPVCRSHLALVA